MIIHTIRGGNHCNMVKLKQQRSQRWRMWRSLCMFVSRWLHYFHRLEAKRSPLYISASSPLWDAGLGVISAYQRDTPTKSHLVRDNINFMEILVPLADPPCSFCSVLAWPFQYSQLNSSSPYSNSYHIAISFTFVPVHYSFTTRPPACSIAMWICTTVMSSK